MSQVDYSMNGKVRAILVRRGIDLGRLEHGVTNSVVYIRGTVRSCLNRQSDDPGQARIDMIQEVTRLERVLRSIPGVRDVVMQVPRLIKVGTRWRIE